MDWEVQYTHVCERVSRKRQVRTLRLDRLGSAIYPCMQKGIQEKTSKDVETGQTGKCNIPMYAKGYPGKDK